MRLSMATRSAALLVCAIILGGFTLTPSHAGVTIDVGDNRALALQFVQQKFGLSENAARSVVQRYEQMHGDRIINSLELPAGAVLDFVRVDGDAADPASMVTYEGSGVLRKTPANLFYPDIRRMLEDVPREQRQHVLDGIGAAVERGWFVETVTREQRDNLMRNNRLPGEEVVEPQQARRVRLLVVLNNFPHWDDRSPRPGEGNFDEGGDREHPVSEAHTWYTPGGPIDDDTLEAGGIGPWSHTGQTTGETNRNVSNHPRLEYRENGAVGTSVHLKERWYSLLFDQNNPMSIARYYFANSHGNLSIEGNRSDIVGPLESRHQLDRVSHIPNVGGIGYDYAIQPGTPVIRRIEPPPLHQRPNPNVPDLRGISADSSSDLIGTLGYNGYVNIARVQIWDDDDGWETLDIDDRNFLIDGRRVIVETEGFDHDDRLRGLIGGHWMSIPINRGFNLDADQGPGASLLSNEDVLGTDFGNRLLSMCYYTHDHMAEPGRMGGRPYQLRHLRSSYRSAIIDDIIGSVERSEDRYPRPRPYDHDIQDHAHPNMGFFDMSPEGGHTFHVWLAHLSAVLADHGIAPTGYNASISLYPSDQAAGQDQGGTSGPWSGPHVFIPNSAVVLPVDAGLYLTAHELGHALMGWPDLYDLDFYLNAMGFEPPRFESNMMGPYSVMADGMRVCAFLKALSGWVTPVAVTHDIVRAEIPEIEGTLRSPVVYKLPGRPHYIANPEEWPPDSWQEYFLVENRNRRGEDYFGDISHRGLYIYHVDMRFGQYEEWHPMVIIEQADGLYELQKNPRYDWGDIEGDPFPGSTGNRHFTQLTNPNSWSHGWVSGIGPNHVAPAAEEPDDPPPGVLQPGSSTDSFSRVANISDPGPMMFADLYVNPREVVVTAPTVPELPTEVEQGTEDFLVMHLHLHNDDQAPNLSRDDVQLDTIRIDENGSSQDDADIARISLWDDTTRTGEFDPERDTRIATARFVNQAARFENIYYPIPLGERRDLFITYDIAEDANTADGNTVGAGIETFDYITPDIPGAVQRRVRDNSPDGLGAHRFPLQSPLFRIIERPDTLTVEPISRVGAEPPLPDPPAMASIQAIEPGQQNVPILTLNMSVDRGSVEINRLRVDQTGTLDGVAHISAVRLYLDQNANGVVDPGDTLLGETRFANVAGVQRASFDLAGNPVRVREETPRSLLLTASLSEDMPIEEPPLTLVYSLISPDYITLLHPRDVVSDENFPIHSDDIATPLPDEPPAPPEDLRVRNLEDGSIMLEWNLSPDDPDVGGEEDVVRYHIYRSQDRNELEEAEPMDYYTTVGAGVTEFNDLAAPLGVSFFYMMRAYDEAGQEGPNSNIAGPIQARDEAAPVFSEFNPERGADNVPRDTTISFVVEDQLSGVNRDSLVFEVDGVDVADAPETTISGTARRLTVEYEPPEPFDYLQEVQVRLQVEDNVGNVAPGTDQFLTYTFTVVPPPTHRIAGVILDRDGDGVPDVRVAAGPLSTRTDADGYYEITGLAAGTYNVTPRREGYSFDPEFALVDVPPDGFGINFTAQTGFNISGIVRTTDEQPLPGVTISTDDDRTAISRSDGTWAFNDLPAGTYALSARLEGWAITPATIEVEVSEEVGSVTDILFEATVETFGISGTIRTTAGERLAGIEVRAIRRGEVVATVETGPTGAYAITDLAPGNYTIRPVSDEYSFEPTQREIEIATDIANVDFTAAPLYFMTLPRGIALIAVPVETIDADPVAVFGEDVQVARWDPQLGGYVVAPSANPLLHVAPGRGFWTRAGAAHEVGIAGDVFPSTSDLSVTLQSRWNMLGNPYDRDLPWERMHVPADGPAANYGFIWDRAANTYRLVSTAPGLGARTTVPRHGGFWMRATASTAVTFRAPGAEPASAEVAERAARQPASDAWIIPIVARAADAMDASSLAGVLPHAAADPEAYRMDNPPALGDYVDLYFLGDNGRRLAVDVRPAATEQTWRFEVATNMAGADVQIQLPDLSEVPHDRVIYLIDEAADRRIYARTMPSYSYNAGEGGTRSFRLEVAERTEAGLTISGASAHTRAGGATVSYTLSSDAHVRVEVLNIAGRTIAVLAADEAKPAGLATSTWNGRSTSGTLVPSGRYLVRINARAEDGQQTQALVPLQLRR